MTTPQYESVEVPEGDYHIERLFPSDLRRDGLIPASLLHHAELAALEAERVRLAAALAAAEAEPGGGFFNEAAYLERRTLALRAGTELPPPPPTGTERAAAAESRNQNIRAAAAALVLWGRTLYQTIAAHPEWRAEAADKVATARAEAEAARRAAAAADARAERDAAYVAWLLHAGHGNVYFPTFVESSGVPQDEPDLVWAVTDPHILGLMATARGAQAL